MLDQVCLLTNFCRRGSLGYTLDAISSAIAIPLLRLSDASNLGLDLVAALESLANNDRRLQNFTTTTVQTRDSYDVHDVNDFNFMWAQRLGYPVAILFKEGVYW